jgi:Putative MetA-pathway of phenol degradation
MTRRAIVVAISMLVLMPRASFAQRTMSDVLGFLLTNRSVATDDFQRDEQAAAATRDTMIRFLLAEIATPSVASPATGFTYRLDPALGSDVRSSASFGPFFIQRSLTVGGHQTSFGVSYQQSSFTRLDGRSLGDGTLTATASRLRGEVLPFDVETLSLRVKAQTVTASATHGSTDRLDVSVAVPLVSLKLEGERVDTYRGVQSIQATADGTSSGLGDILVGGKYNAWRRGGSGVSIGADVRLPTGDETNLLGAGQASIVPRVISSFDRDRVAVHGELSYAAGGLSEAVEYGGALSFVVGSRVTIGGEILGRRLASGGRLVDSVQPNPHLAGVDTIRLVGTAESISRLAVVGGIRWNVASRWLLNASVLRSITSSGLTADWVPTISLDYSFGR